MSTAEDYISIFDRGESKDDLELSYRLSSPAGSGEEGEGEGLLEEEIMGMAATQESTRLAGMAKTMLKTMYLQDALEPHKSNTKFGGTGS
jgi:hypothetical protein